MDIKQMLKDLTETRGLSGFENNIALKLKNILKKYCTKVDIDKYKSIIGYIPCGKKNAKKIMLEAHLDQIGLMVSEIDNKGRVGFINLGGVDERILPGSEVFIVGKSKEIFGIIAEKNTIQNYTTDEKKVKNSKIEELFIDTGYTKKDIEKNIQIGSAVILKSAMKNMLNDKFFGSAMDNRAGIVAILNTLEKLQNKSINYDIYIVFTSQEELGLRGAYTTTFEIMPDYAIAIDVTHGMTPDTKDEIGVFPLGSGAIICRGPNLHYDLTKKIIQIAKENNISHKIEVASGGSGTTAWAIQTVGNGVPVALISIPLRYMHTNVETLSLFDIESVSKLLNKILTGGAFDA